MNHFGDVPETTKCGNLERAETLSEYTIYSNVKIWGLAEDLFHK